MSAPLTGFTDSDFTYQGQSRPVFRRGSGPGVVVMHEIPGITPQVARFATWVADAGFSVAMPVLFGTPGKPNSASYMARQIALACVRREFAVLAAHRASPVTEWLRGLCRALHAECGGPGVGAVGMCITGNFALALMMEPALLAPVLSQPSLPFGLGAGRRAALHLSPAQLDHVKDRCQRGARVLGLRFHGDPLCPPERFDTLRRELGDGFEGIELDPACANPDGNPKPHSVLTTDLIDAAGEPTRAAADRVLEFLRAQIAAGAQPLG